jgi:hypothetical protein
MFIKIDSIKIAFSWISPGTLVSSPNKTDRHDITEILLKVALRTINPNIKTIHMPSIQYYSWVYETKGTKLYNVNPP